MPVKDSKGDLANPWAGGFNSAQFSTIDVNGDGRADFQFAVVGTADLRAADFLL